MLPISVAITRPEKLLNLSPKGQTVHSARAQYEARGSLGRDAAYRSAHTSKPSPRRRFRLCAAMEWTSVGRRHTPIRRNISADASRVSQLAERFEAT